MTPLIFEAALRIALHRFGPGSCIFTNPTIGDDLRLMNEQMDECVQCATTLYAKTVKATKEAE